MGPLGRAELSSCSWQQGRQRLGKIQNYQDSSKIALKLTRGMQQGWQGTAAVKD